MTRYAVSPTGRESPFGEEEIIVSKTDTTGRITYANDVFLRIAGFSEDELIGQPHSIIRQPEMPRCVFKLVWDTIQAGQEVFGYVLNMAKNGDHYWVFAHVTPTFGPDRRITGFHSNRRKPDQAQVDKVRPLYAALLAEENRHENRKEGMNAAFASLVTMLRDKGVGYDEFVFSL
jgi:PAS domain S-box-containing protein